MSEETQQPYLIKCSATGKPTPIINWYKQGKLLTTNSATSEVKFDSVSRTQSGNYTCEAKNIAGVVTSTVEIIVYCKLLVRLCFIFK